MAYLQPTGFARPTGIPSPVGMARPDSIKAQIPGMVQPTMPMQNHMMPAPIAQPATPNSLQLLQSAFQNRFRRRSPGMPIALESMLRRLMVR